MHEVPLRTRPVKSTIDGLTDVIAELQFAVPITLADIAMLETSCTWCREMHRVELVQLFVARNRKRVVLVFRAPDAESVREVCRRVALPVERLWTRRA